MSVIRIKKAKPPYVSVNTTALNDERLSFRACGLHTYLMSKPDNWEVLIIQLEKRSPREGRDAIRTAMQELIDAGYLKRNRKQNRKTGRMAGWESTVYETPELADENTSTESGLSNVGSTNIGLTDVGSTNVGQSAATYSCIYLDLNLPTLDGKKENSLTTFESLSDTGSADASLSDPPQAEALGIATPAKAPKPLLADDWVFRLLCEYSDRFDLNALNDDDWWTDVGNSFPDFGPEWVALAFASLAVWLRDNTKRRPRNPRGWKLRMRFSLNWYYDKKWTRRVHNG